MTVYVGDRIREARENAHFTQEALADAIGVSRTTVTRYELGEIEPRIKNIIAIANVLSVSADTLLGIKAMPAPTKETLSPRVKFLLEELISELRKGEKK